MAGATTVLNERYELIEQIGSGGIAVVYKALDRELSRTVAVKILRPSMTKDPSFLEQIHQIIRSVMKYSHPNLVAIHEINSDGATHYIVMEMVDGQDLKKRLNEVKVFSIQETLNLGIQICSGLSYIHRSGLVHADLKPQNILINKNHLVKISDLGIVHAVANTQPAGRSDDARRELDYLEYASPEQAKGELPNPQSDVYAVGIMFFEMLTGQVPYTGADKQELAMAHIRAPIPNIMEINPAIPEVLSKIIYRAMAKDSHDRYRDAAQFYNVLLQFKEKELSKSAVLRLTVRKGSELNHSYEITKDITTLGRDADNDIVINDPEVSREHLRLIRENNILTVEDFGSINGTFIDEKQIRLATVLKHGDLLELGKTIALEFTSSNTSMLPSFEQANPKSNDAKPVLPPNPIYNPPPAMRFSSAQVPPPYNPRGTAQKTLRIFISYRKTDKALVEILERELLAMKEHVASIWIDKQLEADDNWWAKILENIRVADVVITAVSDAYLDSEPCRREYQYAVALGKEVKLVKIADFDYKRLPELLAQKQQIDFTPTNSNRVETLKRILGKTEAAKALPNPLPPEPEAPLSELVKLEKRATQAQLSREDEDALFAGLHRYIMGNKDDERTSALKIIKNLQARKRDISGAFLEQLKDLEKQANAKKSFWDRLKR